MEGLDLSYRQALTFLPRWARGLQVFANGSLQKTKAPAGRLGSLDETRAAYRLVALQRVLKVVGRFHYLNEVKGKPHYLGMLPAVCRTARHLLAGAEGVARTAELFELAGRDPSRPAGA